MTEELFYVIIASALTITSLIILIIACKKEKK